MAFDFEAIKSENGFYSDHFLESLFETDKEVRDVYERWDEGTTTSPAKRLQEISAHYFRAKGMALNSTDRFDDTRDINRRLLQAFGYEARLRHGEVVATSAGPASVPVIANVKRSGDHYLFVIEGAFAKDDADNLLDRRMPEQETNLTDNKEANPFRGTYEEAVSLIFRRDEPPRWVLILAGNEALLAERHKWTQGKWLWFNLDRMFERKGDVYRQVAVLLAKDVLCTESESVLHDGLDDRSHRHAFGVSADLKDGLRAAVEILANEYIYDLRVRQKGNLFGREDDFARILKDECLKFLYRLLFVFFAEARAGELGIIPMNSEEYRLGYSLEHLRDLELVPLEGGSENGYFIHESLKQLFKLINEGNQVKGSLALDNPMPVPGLRAPLFDEAKTTPNLSKCKLRNGAMQQILQLLSLSKPGKRGRGRISYSQLGINQLGAVYEGILSYSGFFAKEDLYEVRDPKDVDAPIFFVPKSETKFYRDHEFVAEDDPLNPSLKRRKIHERGSFVFQLAGRDRENSASYYTPEVLTKCVVERALKVLLNPEGREPLTASEILELSVLEPAMGSGAFLNEAVNQLADTYLELRQKELNVFLDAQDVPKERQKVKAFIAANNVYGVDLNPIAVELAKVSLWLNSIYEGSMTPWFGLRLAAGNSLIGCRRAVWSRKDVEDGSYRTKPPENLPLGPTWTPLPKGAIYHFLLPDEGMVEVTDKVVKELAPEETKKIMEWRKGFIRERWEKENLETLADLSQQVDKLWRQVVNERRAAAKRCFADIAVFGREASGTQLAPEDQQKVAAELEEPFHAGPRLKLLMDAWCALWFWPIAEHENLPIHELWLLNVETLLKGTTPTVNPQQMMALELEGVDTAAERSFVSKHGYVDTSELRKKIPMFKVANAVAEQRNFHHWELRFAERFADNCGFDLILGNPPWVKLQWQEAGLLSEAEPLFALRKLSADGVARERKKALTRPGLLEAYIYEWQGVVGSSSLFNSVQQYPLLKGGQTNLYKLFVERAFSLPSLQGAIGFLHPEGVYDDPKGGALRRETFQRLRLHAQFLNELKLFSEVHHLVAFSVNVHGPKRSPALIHVSNLYHPRTLAECELHDGNGAVPGIKTDQNEWETRGHKNRLIPVGEAQLTVFAQLLDGEGADGLTARLPVVHSVEMLKVLEKLASQTRRLGDIREQYFTSECWHETNSCKDGTIERKTQYARTSAEWIVSGPHFHVGNPLAQTPNANCSHNQDYSAIDLEAIDGKYLPRTNYVRKCSLELYQKRMPEWLGKRYDEYYRLFARKMLSLTGERSLIGSILPPGTAHIHGVKGFAFSDPIRLCVTAGYVASLPIDFLTRASGKANLSDLAEVPIPPMEGRLTREIVERVLRLACVVPAYGPLWKEVAPTFGFDQPWSDDCAFRTGLERRNALIELDCLVSLQLGLNIEELVQIYKVGFPVLQYTYERPNRYDVNGRLVPSAVLKMVEELKIDVMKKLPPSLPEPEFELTGDTTKRRNPRETTMPESGPVFVAIDHPTLGRVGAFEWEDPKMEPRRKRVYVPPFVGYDREADLRAAYAKFAPLAGDDH